MPTLNQVRRKLERYSVTRSEMTLANMGAYYAQKEDAIRDGTPLPPYDNRFEDVGLCEVLCSSPPQAGGEAVFSTTKPKRGKKKR